MLNQSRQTGISLIEVLVTASVVSFGLLGLALFQVKAGMAEKESYQRAQAIGLLADMTDRIRVNATSSDAYVVNGTVGTGDSYPAGCSVLTTAAARDLCEWSNGLKGASEKNGAANAAGLTGGRGCITLINASNPAVGVCTPATYEVSVAWQGAHPTLAPNNTCGQTMYGADETLRRVIISRVTIGLPGCS